MSLSGLGISVARNPSMEPLFGLFFLLGILFVVVQALRLMTRRKASRPKISSDWQPPKADQLAYSRKNYFFSAAERSFYEILRRLAPNHTVFAKVRLADLIYVDKRTTSRQADLNRICSKHVDFVLCDSNLAPVLAIELDDSSHDDEDRQSRDSFIDAAFSAANFPLIRIPCKRGYRLDEVRQLLAPYSNAECAGTGA
jgi:hypothetical protein